MFDFMDTDFNQTSLTPSAGPYIPDASDCMRCGMCVNACPTFKLFQTAEETPRNRIRTISKILLENQAITTDERGHLDNCLQCRACETVCPSKMAYGQLFDLTQAQLQTTPNGLGKLAFGLIANKRWRTRLMPLLRLYLLSGLQKPLRWTGWLKKWHLAEAEALLTQPSLQGLAGHYPANFKPSTAREEWVKENQIAEKSPNKLGQVALFTGCIAEHFDQDTLQAAIQVLNAIGYDVIVPPEQNCCGAIHQHNGHSADAFITHNMKVFNTLKVDAVLHAATGCGAMLSEYQHDDSDAVDVFKARLQDINAFILAHWPENLLLQPLPGKVAVHEPCSQRNILKNQQTVYDLLAKIPHLQVISLADNHWCCGAGGTYLLSHPDNALPLRTLKQQAINAAHADWVVSSNFGCAVFLNRDGYHIKHPLYLLARQLPCKG